MMRVLHDPATDACVRAERALSRALAALPVAARPTASSKAIACACAGRREQTATSSYRVRTDVRCAGPEALGPSCTARLAGAGPDGNSRRIVPDARACVVLSACQ